MKVVDLIMHFAPVGAFGAMAFTIGKFGLGILAQYGMLIVSLYLTFIVFIAVFLGGVMRFYVGLSLWKLFRYSREELFILLGTTSSESVLPRIMAKLNGLGVDKSVTGLVMPAGLSFNMDGSCIYLTMAIGFIAQAPPPPSTGPLTRCRKAIRPPIPARAPRMSSSSARPARSAAAPSA